MNNKTKLALTAVGITAVSVTAINAMSTAATKYLVKVALDREQPKNTSKKAKNKLVGSAERKPFVNAIAASAKKLEAENTAEVAITSHDGLRLIGHLRTCEKPKRVILAMHGWRSSWSRDFGMIADFWYENDCDVLFAEQRGQNKSGGDYMGFGMLERYDCLGWIRFLNEHGYSNLPIYLGGVSMGASTVLMTSGFSLPDNVRGIVADCGFTSASAIWKHVVKNNMHMSYRGRRDAAADELCKKRIHIGANAYTTFDALQTNKIPVLFIHGTDDKFVPIEMTYENYKTCSAEKYLFVVPGADHGMSYFSDKEGYETAVKNFWKTYDQII